MIDFVVSYTRSSAKYDDGNPDNMIGATIVGKSKSNWDSFYLVVRYIDKNGMNVNRTLVKQ